jgi:CelD/BcsL family acetyltransferase involved in cellulose biosynthesis
VDAEILTDRAALEELAPAWRDLLADSDGDEPTMSPEWLLTWWDLFGGQDGRRLNVVVLRENGELVGLAPLLSRRHWYKPGVPFRRVEPLASGERRRDAVCSDYLSVVARDGYAGAVADAVIDQLASRALGRWDEFVLPLMDGDKPMAALLAQSARRAGLIADVDETTRAPYIPLPSSWPDYLSLLAKKKRYLINRSLRDFDAWAADDWSLEEASASTLDEARNALHALHAQRWEDDGGGVFTSPLFVEFHDRMMPLLLESKALELLTLRVHGTPVAAMYNIRWRNKTYFYQCGRSLDVPAHIRPGGVIIYLAIRRAIEAGCGEFDFLGGEALYKDQLALASRSIVRLRVVRPGVRERTRLLVESAKPVLRKVRHTVRTARRGQDADQATEGSAA